MLLACTGSDVYKIAPAHSQAQLAEEHGLGVYYYYHGHVSRVAPADGDVEAAVADLAIAASRSGNSPADKCEVLRDRIYFFENGYYAVTVKCDRW